MKFEPAQFTTKLILPAEELDRVTSHLDNLSKSLPIDISFQSQDVTLKELTVTTSISTHKAVVELLKAMDLPEDDVKKLARVKSYVEIALQNLTHRILSNIRLEITLSLRYIYNQLAQINTERDKTFIDFLKRLDYPQETINILVSWLNEKNPTGLLLFDCNTAKLLRLLPKYMVELMTPNVMDSFISQQYFKVFDKLDQKIIRHTTTLYEVINDSSTANRIYPLEGIKKELLNEPELNMNDVFECFTFGQDKYSDWDFIKLNPNILVPSFFRHYYKHYYVSKTDTESGLPHIAHTFCNVLMIEHILQGKRK